MTFEGFSEAARLYAENVAVVREMEKAYRANMTAFLEVFEREIARIAAPEVFNVYETKPQRWRYWWLTARRPGGALRVPTEAPHLYFTNGEPDEIAPDGIALTAGCGQKNDKLLAALIALPATLPTLERWDEGEASRWNLFYLGLDFEGDDFIDRQARAVVEVLKAMSKLDALSPRRGRAKR